MNVLSLFDGISCGQIALERAGIKVDNYFSSEIDKYAMTVTQHHYPNTIQLGDINKWKNWNLPKIDLVIGGSPCQGFSKAGKGLNFNDPRSRLFFVFIDILKQYNPKHFLLENVKMKKEWQNIISNYIKIQPTAINSMVISKQNRNRLYWTNINIAPFPEFYGRFNQYLYRLGHGYIKDEIKFFEFYPSLAAQSPASKYRIIMDYDTAISATFQTLRKDKNVTRSATPEECEEFQTLPMRYTDILNKTRRYTCIGNGWTVDVIAHIFQGLKGSK